MSMERQSQKKNKYRDQLVRITCSEIREKIAKEISRFEQLDPQQSEYYKLNQYLDDVFAIPWNTFTKSDYDTRYAEKILSQEIFGMQDVKDRIIQEIGIKYLKNSGQNDKNEKGFVLLLYGPPGTGKSSIAKAIGKSLKRETRFISFGGVNDQSFIKGHKRTYVDSTSGVFIQELIKAKTMNPVFVLDEIDKIGISHQGNPYYSLLELLNEEESENFQDHYLDFKVDFSKCIFILTANSVVNMLDALKSRIEVIEVPPYILEEKQEIGYKYIIPKVMEQYKLTEEYIKFDKNTVKQIVQGYCYYEAGVRQFKKEIEKIVRKLSVEILKNHPSAVDLGSQLDNENDYVLTNQIKEQLNIPTLDLTVEVDKKLIRYLQNPIFDYKNETRMGKTYLPGTVNILTVASFTGFVSQIEAVVDKTDISKKGQITVSGNLKKVITESVNIAKLNAFKYLNEEQRQWIQENNIHMHFMDGGSKKDGPSAGGAICTAILSLTKGMPVKSNIAMTGELQLNGQIKEIGGLQAKLIAAKSVDCKQILIPYQNIGECLKLPQLLLKDLEIYVVQSYNQIYEMLFSGNYIQIDNGFEVLPEGVYVILEGKLVNKESYFKNIRKEQQQMQGIQM